MRIYQVFILLLMALFANTTAYAYCKLNIRGDSICLDKKVLFNPTSEEAENADQPPVKMAVVVEMNYPKVFITVDGEELEVSIDTLVSTQECAPGEAVCEDDKIYVAHGCGLKEDKKYKVNKVFRNEMIEIRTGGFLFFKSAESHILPLECVDRIAD